MKDDLIDILNELADAKESAAIPLETIPLNGRMAFESEIRSAKVRVKELTKKYAATLSRNATVLAISCPIGDRDDLSRQFKNTGETEEYFALGPYLDLAMSIVPMIGFTREFTASHYQRLQFELREAISALDIKDDLWFPNPTEHPLVGVDTKLIDTAKIVRGLVQNVMGDNFFIAAAQQSVARDAMARLYTGNNLRVVVLNPDADDVRALRAAFKSVRLIKAPETVGEDYAASVLRKTAGKN